MLIAWFPKLYKCTICMPYMFQAWFQEEEQRLLSDVEFKIDNLDARNLRQLNQLYAEIQKVEGELGIAMVHQL